MLLDVITCCCTVFLDVTNSYYMLCSIVTCYQDLLHAVQCCYMLPRVITFCAVLLRLLHDVQCCSMWPRFIICCPVLLNFI